MKKKIAAIKEYLKYFPYDSSVENNLMLCEYADELGIELNKGYYPTIQYGYFVINNQIKIGKEYYLTNSTTRYKQNGEDSLVIWTESCGRLAFVSDRYWWDIEDEWKEFMNVLKSYEPLDYDELNNNYIYDMEHGKKLIQYYDRIVKDFMSKVNRKIKEVEIANKKKEIERLQKELEEA
jgi:hypothetical protein